MKKTIALFAFGALLASCSDDEDSITEPMEPTPVVYTSGTADFTKYVSVGNSLTAGYSDSALFTDGQTASFTNMLAGNFALAGGGDFNIPLMSDNLGGLTLGGEPLDGFGNRLILSFITGSPNPVPVNGQGTTEITNVISGPFNNMGVPGAKSFHLGVQGYGNVQALPNANPYFIRMASSPNATVIGDAVSQNPTFFSLWIGNNDILGYATSGGAGEDHNETNNFDPTTYGSNDITNTNVFASVYNGLLEALTANDAGGVLVNIPDVTTIPYFTTVPFNPVPLDAATADQVNSGYALYNGGVENYRLAGLISDDDAAARTITFAEGLNAVVIVDEFLIELPGLPKYRQTTASDLMVLTARSFIGTLADPSNPASVNGIGVPLADNWVLTPQEQEDVAIATEGYNAVIANMAIQYDLPLVDANTFLTSVAISGVTLSDGSNVTATYGTGGAFSLDGVHPSPRGYSLIANEFVKQINTKYGSNLPGVDPLDYKGLYIN
ncbi:G-D-S-L family lipolytic protein [Cellulophaga sp. HaHaR_3_176]|uniref:G-D-S-L family lipolytic protein n=1 Tax=Cellulophaga sp. HaHaR_3_176 TaxID=1942464 RepID=UPI001C1F43EE|nr:G-D-S-L family lipolytic protein [Cellulophaga sp. HaHaR_3_176]QWX84117.1 G-D-S-L family lipolytic protein [Cellulophaga sp. HaHaR_3_176]